jgi:choline dehydrogenase-like flavoprotein
MREVCRNAPNSAFDYGDPRGITAFRELLADTVYHPACTAKMGADDDPMAVLDVRFRVRGVDGLRVADGSAMPFLVAVNPCITTMAIGVKCADLIKEDAQG